MNSVQLAKRDQIADFVRRRQVAHHQYSPFDWNGLHRNQNLWPLEKFVEELLSDAEFRSLQLSTWLGTTDGEIISDAVGLVILPIYRPEYKFFVEGLKLAAIAQQKEGQKVAARIALGVAGAGSLVFLIHYCGGLNRVMKTITNI